jgi:hypothetical protein
MNLSLLFDKIDPEKVSVNTDLGILESEAGDTHTNYLYDSSKEWGTPQNPYIISELRHLQNLSVLQNIGYFDQLYISKNYENGVYKGTGTVSAPGEPIMPYFLICKPDGRTTTIDGNGITIKPIGTDTLPFIGYVGGAFAPGTSTSVGDLTSDISAIYNLFVQSSEDMIDVGTVSVMPIYSGLLEEDKTSILFSLFYKDKAYTYTTLPMLEGKHGNYAKKIISDSETVIFGSHGYVKEYKFNLKLENAESIIFASDKIFVHSTVYDYYKDKKLYTLPDKVNLISSLQG